MPFRVIVTVLRTKIVVLETEIVVLGRNCEFEVRNRYSGVRSCRFYWQEWLFDLKKCYFIGRNCRLWGSIYRFEHDLPDCARN